MLEQAQALLLIQSNAGQQSGGMFVLYNCKQLLSQEVEYRTASSQQNSWFWSFHCPQCCSQIVFTGKRSVFEIPV